MHAARTIYAHYHAALDGDSLWTICKPKLPGLANEEENRRIRNLVNRLQSEGRSAH